MLAVPEGTFQLIDRIVLHAQSSRRKQLFATADALEIGERQLPLSGADEARSNSKNDQDPLVPRITTPLLTHGKGPEALLLRRCEGRDLIISL